MQVRRAHVEDAETMARVMATVAAEGSLATESPVDIALYAAAGFAVEGLKRDHYRRRDGSLRSALLMALRLDQHHAAARWG